MLCVDNVKSCVIGFLTLLCALIVLGGICKYVTYYCKNEKTKSTKTENKYIFITCLLLFIVISIEFIFYITMYFSIGFDSQCYAYTQSDSANSFANHPLYKTVFKQTIAILFFIQMYLLLLALFLKLYYVFKTSEMRLSVCVVRIYRINFILLIPIIMLSLFWNQLSFKSSYMIVSLTYTWLFLLSISLFILFINKLYRVYKTSDKDSIIGQRFLSVISRQTICAVSCISISFGTVITLVILQLTGQFFIFALWTLLDLFSNAIFMFFTYSCFNRYYYALCGCIDQKFQLSIVESQSNITVQQNVEITTVSSNGGNNNMNKSSIVESQTNTSIQQM
eukprot:31480_1